MMVTSKSEGETKKIAARVAKKVKNGGFIALFGDLGSGKTVFVKGLAEAFNIKGFSVKSPTYTYVRHYPLKIRNIYHIDLYRLEKIDELLLQEILELMEDDENIIIIEWAEKMGDYLPTKRIDIVLKYIDENSRRIEIREANSLQEIYKEFHVPRHIIKHMEMVAKVCGILADKLIEKGKKIDKKTLIEAALLHDVLKVCHEKCGKLGHEKA
ncbi:MAG: tRNA (adenosine(37)-N6)-threonylcarbamoyltransferase complex ATPase subunit type 1 TsaE, partial [Patescibacteria group bacterium]